MCGEYVAFTTLLPRMRVAFRQYLGGNDGVFFLSGGWMVAQSPILGTTENRRLP